MYVVWTTAANATNLVRTKSKSLPQLCFAMNCKSRHLTGFFLFVSPGYLDQSVPLAQILPQMKLASRASRPGLVVGILRSLCNGLCTAQRFHMEGEAQMCRIGYPDEPASLLHYNEYPLLYNLFTFFWRQTTMLPRRSHLFHDMITQVLLRSLQYGIMVMGLIDAFVYAHNHQLRNMENYGNFGDCMRGRIRFMTAITPAYANAYQSICLVGRPPESSAQVLQVFSTNVSFADDTRQSRIELSREFTRETQVKRKAKVACLSPSCMS